MSTWVKSCWRPSKFATGMRRPAPRPRRSVGRPCRPDGKSWRLGRGRAALTAESAPFSLEGGDRMISVKDAQGTQYDAAKHSEVYGLQKITEAQSKRTTVCYSYFQPYFLFCLNAHSWEEAVPPLAVGIVQKQIHCIRAKPVDISPTGTR